MKFIRWLFFLGLVVHLGRSSNVLAQDWYAGFVRASQAAHAQQQAQLDAQKRDRWCQKYRDIPNAGYPNTVVPRVVYCLDEKQQLGSPIWLKASSKALPSQLNVQLHQSQWAAILRLIPHFYRPYIKSVVFMNSPLSGAITKAIDLPKRSFSFAVDLEQEEVDDVLWIHEWMHVLSHRNLHLSGEYYQSAPYLNDFNNLFWGAATPHTQNDLRRTKIKNTFVSNYAAQNVEEDLAESFAAYVTGDPRFNITRQNRAKLDFFDRYPETKTYKAWYRSLPKPSF